MSGRDSPATPESSHRGYPDTWPFDVLQRPEVQVNTSVTTPVTTPTNTSSIGTICVLVVVDGIPERANCHLGKEDHRCSFNTNATARKSRRPSKYYSEKELKGFQKEVEALHKERKSLRNLNSQTRRGFQRITANIADEIARNPSLPTSDRTEDEVAEAHKEYYKFLRGDFLSKLQTMTRATQIKLEEGYDKQEDIFDRFEDLNE
ncbi:uncharacterized protein N7483_010350 [Penicillium malachiteum]|uniref:uncharacterized protein n=1 Tax=Penicillium malachiteum TaxID=1324776 RepID=UPI002546ED7A|nr:uncharacterized protein N7483_010350 [Penicillium malachiteum]KAJ5713169.1 hypothetical protein N7483_010350 [Penicillium malachiteum]